MRRFKDLTTMEKAAFEDFCEVVEKFLPIELMHEGIVYPDEPMYEDEVDDNLKSETGSAFYRLTISTGYRNVIRTPIFFAASDVADAGDIISALQSLNVTFYANQYEWDKSLPEKADLGVSYETFYPESVVKLREDVAKRNEAIRAANGEKSKAYNEAMSLVEEVKSNMRDEWSAAVDKVYNMTRIVDTFNKYVELAGGDRQVAMRFLLSARPFDKAAIAEALNEHGISIDESLLAPAAPSESAEA